MRHYEIILVVKQNLDTQMRAIVDRYQSLITESGGTIHRYEDWGKRTLAYPIDKHTKGHYLLMNVESDPDVIVRINTLANTNETLLRYFVLQMDEAVTEPSVMMRAKQKAETERSTRRPPATPAPAVAGETEQVCAGENANTEGTKEDVADTVAEDVNEEPLEATDDTEK